jgi:hypothetical protein
MNDGHARFARWDFGGAAEAFRAALRAEPASVAARVNLALALLRNQYSDEAAGVLEPLAGSAERSVQVDYLYGLAQLGGDRAAEAVDSLRRAAQRDPREVAIRFQLAVALEQAGQAAEAAETFREVIRRDRFHVTAPLRLAAVERRAGNFPEAGRLLQRSQRNRQILGDAAARREAEGLNRYTRPLDPPREFQPAAESSPVRWVEVTAEGDLPVGRVALIDLDNDARIELVGRSSTGRWRGWQCAAGRLREVTASIEGPSEVEFEDVVTADFDNDGQDDLFWIGPTRALFQRAAARAPAAPTSATQPATSPAEPDPAVFESVRLAEERVPALDEITGARALAADLDHDGDVDLLIWGAAPGLRVLHGAEPGAFTDATAAVALPALDGDLERVLSGVAVAEINDDDAVDIALAGRRCCVLFNAGQEVYNAPESPPQVIERRATAVAVNDLNNDGLLDVAWLTHKDEDTVEVIFSDPALRPIDDSRAVGDELALLDYDNDGFLDVLLAGPGGLRLWRNLGAAGWRDATVETRLDAIAAPATGRVRVSVADVDHDGDPDLLLQQRGRPLRWIRNDASGPGGALALRLEGAKSNRSAVGARVDIRDGPVRIFRHVAAQPILIGVGRLTRVESLTVLWPSGISDGQFGLDVAATRKLLEPEVMLGSCPYLYAWDGTRFRFVTDILGNAPLGLSLTRELRLPADTDEIVRLGDASQMGVLSDADGTPTHVVEIGSELHEVAYLDAVRLLIVDCPPHVELHPVDRLMPPPFPPSELLVVSDLRAPRAAWLAPAGSKPGSSDPPSVDVTSHLAASDGTRTGPLRLRTPQLRGLAEPHALTLDFGPLPTERPLVLVLEGWLQYGDASVNIAASQHSSAGNPFPTLEARTADGAWHAMDVTVGAPAGKPKSIAIDLTGKLPADTIALRLSSALEVYWDRIAIGERAGRVGPSGIASAGAMASCRLVERTPRRADLRFRGVSRCGKPARNEPLIPIYEELRERPPWRTVIEGWCTRFGDVLPLLSATDGRLAIFNTGDVVRIAFDARGLSEAPLGWRREFFLYSVGWEKDSDHHILSGNTVEPLPYHGMDDQAYGTDAFDRSPQRARWPDWAEEYNTRWVGEQTDEWVR